MSKIRAHLTYANAMSTIAVFMILGGTAYAVGLGIPRNSITSLFLAQNSVKESEIAPGAVLAKEIGAKAVGSQEISIGAVQAQQIGANAVGASEIKTSAVSAREIAPDAIASQELARASVKTAQIATGAVRSPEIEDEAVREEDLALALLNALRAPTAFGHVNADGTIDAANSRNLVAVADNNAGVYCLNATGLAPKSATVSLEITAAGSVTDQTRVSLSANVLAVNCAGFPQADIIVETTNSAGAGVPRPFYISVD